MQYTVLFFAVSAEQLAERMNEASDEWMEEIRHFVASESDDSDAVDAIVTAAKALCKGQIPADAPQPYFDAFYAIANTFGERIELESFQFNTCVYLEEIGIWPWTQEESPPFPMPRMNAPLPQFGFMSNDFLRTVVLPGMEQLPPSGMAREAQTEFAEVVESVADDGLDLIAYYYVW